MALPVTSLHVSFLTLPGFNTICVAWKSSYETRAGQRLSVGICYAKGQCTFEESCLSLQHRGSNVKLLTVCSFMLRRTDCYPPVTVHFKLSGEGLTYHIYSLIYFKVSTPVYVEVHKYDPGVPPKWHILHVILIKHFWFYSSAYLVKDCGPVTLNNMGVQSCSCTFRKIQKLSLEFSLHA